MGRNQFNVDVVRKREAEGRGERVSVLMNRAVAVGGGPVMEDT